MDRRAQPLSRRVQLTVTIAVLVLLVVATIWGWHKANLSFDELNWVAIAVSFCVAAPLTLILKAFEYDAAARLIGERAAPRRALDIAVISSAANLLPIPGSLLVTTRALSEQGATYAEAAVASTVPSLSWLTISVLIGGVSIAIAGNAYLGASIALAGVVLTGVTFVMFRRTAPVQGRLPLALRIIVIETCWVLLGGLRMWLALKAIGSTGTPAQVLALALAGAMSVAIGFLPSGIGAREAFIALLSPIIKLPVSRGVVLGVLDRLIWVTFLALVAVALVIDRARKRTPKATAVEATS